MNSPLVDHHVREAGHAMAAEFERRYLKPCKTIFFPTTEKLPVLDHGLESKYHDSLLISATDGTHTILGNP